jgi:peptidoglycan/LPS O-acetylase OafA/YrhL
LVPLLYLASRLIGTKLLLALFTLAWILFFTLYATKLLAMDFPTRWLVGNSLLCQLHAFMVGFALSIMYSKKIFFGKTKPAFIILMVCSILLVFVLKDRTLVKFAFHAVLPMNGLYESILWGMILYASLIIGKSVLGATGRFLSRISYSLYLVHVPVLVAVKSNIVVADYSPEVNFIIGLAISILAATTLFYIVENPLLKLKDRVRQRQMRN